MKFAVIVVISFGISLNLLSQPTVNYGSNPTAGKYLEVNDIKLYYEIYGEGEPLIVLHGGGGSIQDMGLQVASLSRKFKVYAIDSRAQGRSTDSEKEISYALMASDVAEFINKLKLGSVNLLGWSDGGIIGLELAYAFPDKVRKMVIIGSNFSHENFLADSKQTVFMDKGDSLILKTRGPIMRYFESSHRLSANPKKLPEIQKKLNEMEKKYPSFNGEQLGKINTPTLVIAGDHDIISDKHTLELYANLPHAQLCIIPGATHLVIWEQPELVNSQAIRFLKAPYRDIDRYYFYRQ